MWLMCFPLAAVSQQVTVKGIIMDSATVKPVAYATINMLDESRQPVASAYSNEDGTFKTIVAKPGTYQLVISSLGYGTKEISLQLPTGVTSLGSLPLTASTSQLKEVTVTSRKQLIDQKPGMLIYNAENDVSNKGGTAADVLRKAPVLNVDAQGNVTMRGSGSLKILINGKYSGQMARSPADALNMMPAEIIKSVEIITTPSARYDAEGAAGVINIITKKNNKSVSGALEASASNLEQVFNPRIAFAKDKWSLNAYAHLHRLRSKSASGLERTSLEEGIHISQQKEEENTAPHGATELSVDYTPDSLSTFSLGFNTWFGNWPGDNTLHNTVTQPDGTVLEQYHQAVKTKAAYLGADISLGYTRKLKRPGQEIILLGQFSPSKDDSRYRTEQTGNAHNLLYRELNNSHTNNREFTFQADYIHPLSKDGKYILESGVKGIMRNVGNGYDVSASKPQQPDELEPQPGRTDHFAYQQRVAAGYALLKMNLQKNWYVEAGARLEGTFIEGDFRMAGTRFENNFLNFVPTANITKKINAFQTVSLSYTKRLTRPYIWDLNPNADASDPKNIRTGNPHLQPEIAHQAELSYGLTASSGFFLNAALFLKQTDNSIEEYTTTDAQGISLTSKQNLATNRQYGLNLSSSVPLLPRWSVNGNVNINHVNYKSTALLIVQNGWAADINLNTTYRLPDNFALQAFGDYTTRTVILQGYQTQRYYYSFAARKELPAQKVIITLAAVNPFTYAVRQTEVISAAGFDSQSFNRYYNRAVKLTLNWEFGRTFEQRSKRKINNDDVQGSPKG